MREVYEENYLPIYRYFYYKGIEREHIKDLVHDVFLIFFQKYSTKDGLDARKILYTISRNSYKQWVRKQKNHISLDEEYHFDEYYDDKFEVKRESKRKEMLALIESLNEGVRDVIKCRFLLGMNRKETAEKLNISQAQVHTYQKRGIKYIKEKIKKSKDKNKNI